MSLAELNGCLRTGSKSLLFNELIKNIECPPCLQIPRESTLILDGMALIQTLGMNKLLKTFGDYGMWILDYIIKLGTDFERVDIVFDRYNNFSIKSSTREKRKKGPIVRKLVAFEVPLPQDWIGFLSLGDNKTDLSHFLSQQIIKCVPDSKTFVVGGGFREETRVESNRSNLELHHLMAIQEEADTRLILHCKYTSSKFVCTMARDTDILILLLAHSTSMKNKLSLAMKSSKKLRFLFCMSMIYFA